MSETYTRINWKDGENGGTPISADNLNLMDLGIEKAHQLIEELKENGVGGVTEEQLKNAVDAYFIKNPIQTVSDIFMRVSDGYIQFSTDNLTWKNVIAVSELKGQTGKTAYEYAKDGGYTGTEEEFAKKLAQENPTREEFSQLSDTIADLTGGTYSPIEPKEDDIPKVFIDGEIPTSKTDVLAELTYVSKTDNFHAYLEIKCQGDSSLSYPKKNFTIKMFSDDARETKLKKEFKGWGEHNKFVLKANYIDHSHARNIVSAKLWGQIVATRSDYNSLPTGLKTSPNNGAIEGFPVKVYNNGTYQGIYTWNIPKDDWLYGVDEDDVNQFVLYGQHNTNGTYAETANNFRALWDGVSQSDGQWEVEVGTNSDIVKTALNNVISLCMNADDETFKNTLNNYLDVQSALDYYIFVYTICALDSLAQNMILVSYDGTKLYCSAYDLDSTFGLWWNGQSFVSTSYRCPEDYQEPYSLLWERIEKLYADELKERYAELRNSVLSLSNMFTQFERFMDVIGLDLYAEDLTVYTGIPSGSTNNIKQIRNYIRDRLTYCDAEFEAMNGETEPDVPEETIPATGITLNQTSLSFTNGAPITLTATVVPSNTTDKVTWSSDDTSIATVIGGVVTPISNGSCTITAIAGSVSETCMVSISGLVEKIWSDTKTNRIDNETGIAYTTGGDAYVSEYIEVADDVSRVTLQNINGGQFKWKELYAYDSNKAYLGKVDFSNGSDGGKLIASTITKGLFPDMAYVRATATGDTEPNSKLEFVFEIGEIVNPLYGVEFINGSSYDKETGELKAINGEVCTGKFKLGNGMYDISVQSGSYPALFVWNEDGEFLFKCEQNVGKTIGRVSGHDGYEYALKVYNSGANDNSVFIITPVENNATEQVTVTLSDLTWTWKDNSRLEASLLAIDKLSSINDVSKIKSVSEPSVLYNSKYGGENMDNLGSTPTMYNFWVYAGSELLLCVHDVFTNADEAKAYFAENETTITIGVRA